MAIDGGKSCLGAMDALHPIHEHHEVLRKQGFRPVSSEHNQGTRHNRYVGPENVPVEVSYTKGAKKPIEHETTDPEGFTGTSGRTPKQLEKNIKRETNSQLKENDYF